MEEMNKDKKRKKIEGNDKFHVDDQVMYRNILGEWHKGTVIKVNNTTIRILNKDEFKVLSIKPENVLTMEEYENLKNK
ncbi:hypothetical protein BBF96_04790 [Anoxybacter fermentans]|uniref:Uncharacterized protein n=1 Tax=Anoxybacter fermentans TaxID=1323375 RepID=A0A3Q9HPJ1_9FIRM|nr:hypothetical protein [Anoxybacter fermentans]AZR72768.1 hypothetical protein BBF96_04790 [Anoxybacter fermentans]